MKILSFLCISLLWPPPHAAAAREKVAGIGGFFFRSQNPAALSQWYLDNLGVALPPRKFEDTPWSQEAGVTNFEPFAMDNDYFDLKKGWMVNFRVKNLDAMVTQLRASGIAVRVEPQTEPNGRFAHLQDPEGNPIELWEPRDPNSK